MSGKKPRGIECKHDLLVKNMCSICGEDLNSIIGPQSQNKHQVVLGNGMKIQLSESLMRQKVRENTNALLRSKKLLLILDIDHTLLHAGPGTLKVPGSFRKGVHSFEIFNSKSKFLIKLRPGLKNFLETVSKFYDVRVYTMGVRPYAEKILEIIDSEQKYIGKRCVCRDDFEEGEQTYKNHHRLFPVKKKLVVVLDDRVDVWKNISKNVIQVPKFFFFGDMEMKSNRINLSEDVLAQRERDNVLQTAQNKLLALHSVFYREINLSPDNKDINLKNDLPVGSLKKHQSCARILKEMRNKVLFGVKVLFSGIYPVGTNIKKTKEWKLARSLGAHCIKNWDSEKLTHVIGFERITDKIKRAIKNPKIKVVSLYWLYHCANHCAREKEEKFQLKTLDQREFTPGNQKKFPLVCWSDSVPSIEEFVKRSESLFLNGSVGKCKRENENGFGNKFKKKEMKSFKVCNDEELDKELDRVLWKTSQ